MFDAAPSSVGRVNRAKQLIVLFCFCSLLSTAATLPFLSSREVVGFLFQIEISVEKPSRVQLFFDPGDGFSEANSVSQSVTAGGVPKRLQFALPPGTVRALRLDPADGPTVFTLWSARLVSTSGREILRFRQSDIIRSQEIASLDLIGGAVRATTVGNASDPQLLLRLDKPVRLEPRFSDLLLDIGPIWFSVLIGSFTFIWLLGWWQEKTIDAFISRFAGRPVTVLMLAASAAVAIQCHPVLFLGRSFVSPDNAGFLLYDHFPTLPGYQSTGLEDGKGSDVGAILYSCMHYPGLEWDAVFKDHELPLWNRYVQGGVPLLGQGQSMFGGILNMIPMLGGSSALSWDIHFLLSRWLYAFGIGLAVWRLTRHLLAAALTSLTCVFVGFFAYRLNHMAQFSVDLAPWIVVAWLLLRDASTRQGAAWSLLLLGIANWETISSGTVKEAYMLVLFLNLAGSALIAVSPRRPTERLRLIAGAACAGVVLVLVSAPLWLVFLDTLAKSTTHYDHRITRQARFSELIGFFEDLFARQLRPNESHAYPSANIVILLGCCWAIVGGWRARIREPWVLIMAAAIPLALAFGVIPGDLLHNIPLVSRIEHFDNTFGCVLLVLLTLLSGFGMKFMFTERAARQWLQPAAMAMGGCLVLVGLFYASNRECSVSRFFIFYALSLVFGILALHLALRGSACILHRGLGTAGLLAALSVLLWRHSQYLHTPFDAYVFNPKVRANLTASSPAVERVRQLSTEPNRATGLGYNLFSGYSMAIRLETIYGVEPLRNAYFDELTIGGGINKMNWGDPASWNENDARVLLPLLELLNVRFYLSTPNPPPNQVDNLRLLGRYDLDVFDSPGTWPRAYVTNNIGTYATVRDLLKLLKQPNRPKPFAFVQDSDPESLRIPAMSPAPKRYAARATGYILTSNSTSFTIEAPGPGVAVLTETYNPDFQVTLNGAPASLLRVNHAFRGVWVPRAGVYRVRFAYWPSIVTRALWIAAIGASLGVLGFWLIHSGRIQVIGETLSSECDPS